MAIIDEAGLVEPGIFADMEDRCSPDHFLMAGAPMDPIGNCTTLKPSCRSSTRTITSANTIAFPKTATGLMSETLTARLRNMAGNIRSFSPMCLASSAAGWRTPCYRCASSTTALSLARVNNFDKSGRAFVDVAGGVCKNVFAVRQGNKIWIEKKWIEQSEMATCGEVLAIANRLKISMGLKPEEIAIDASGAGKPMADRLREMGLNCHRFTGQSKPTFDQEYANAISEVWGTGTSKIRSREVVIPDDEDFRAQVLSRTLKRNSSGKFQIRARTITGQEAFHRLTKGMLCSHVFCQATLWTTARGRRYRPKARGTGIRGVGKKRSGSDQALPGVGFR